MSNKSIVRITSDHVFSIGEDPYKFNVQYDSNSVTRAVKGYSIRSMSFNNTEYNVPAGENGFNYSLDGITVLTVYLNIGQYNVTTFMNAVTVQLGFAGITASFSQNAITQKIRCDSCSPAIQFFDYHLGVENHIGHKLGINKDHGIVSIAQFGNVPDLTGLTSVSIRSNALIGNSSLENITYAESGTRTRYNKAILSNIIEIVHCNTGYGFPFSWYNNSANPITEFENPRNLANIDINITDQGGYPINLEGSEFILVIELYH